MPYSAGLGIHSQPRRLMRQLLHQLTDAVPPTLYGGGESFIFLAGFELFLLRLHFVMQVEVQAAHDRRQSLLYALQIVLLQFGARQVEPVLGHSEV